MPVTPLQVTLIRRLARASFMDSGLCGGQSYATLISSDSEDEEGGVVASAKRWWSNSSNKKDP